MKILFAAFLLLTSVSAFANPTSCGGRSGPCPGNGPEWDGTYAPGFGPGSPNWDYNHTPRTPQCGGRNGPCPGGPEWDGNYAPGFGPGSPNWDYNHTPRNVQCGGRERPCPMNSPEYRGGCMEGMHSWMSFNTGRSGMRQMEVVCHSNRWMRVGGRHRR